MTKAERAAEMSRVRKLGVKRAKTKARALRQNNRLRKARLELSAVLTETGYEFAGNDSARIRRRR